MGIIGAASAHHLAMAGAHVNVIARRSSTTAGSLGVVRAETENPELSRWSLPWFREWRDRVGGDCGYVESGVLVRRASEGAVQERFEEQAGYVDASRAARAYLRAAARNRTFSLTTATVRALRDRGGSVEIESSLGVERYDAVVVASGVWSSNVFRGWDHNVRWIGVRPAQTVTASGYDGASYVVIDLVHGLLVRPDGRSRCTLGVRPELVDFPSVAQASRWQADAAYFHTARERLARSGWGNVSTLVGGRRSYYDVTADGRPYLGRIGGTRVYAGVGLNGGGVKVAPAIGYALATAVCGDEPPFPTWADYAPDRSRAHDERTPR